MTAGSGVTDSESAARCRLRRRDTAWSVRVEWSRVEPLPGHVDEAALDRYRHWCLALHDAGITPMITLHHFTEPDWTSERGGFAHPETGRAWLRFVERCLDRFVDVVRHWVTVNEPVAYVAQGWLVGEWPPGRRDPRLAAQVLENLLLAHGRAYRLIHDRDRGDRRHRVGPAHNIMPIIPERPLNPYHRVLAGTLDRSYNRAVPEALRTGVLRLRLPGLRFTARHPGLRGSQDFFGINHYHRVLLRARPRGPDRIRLLPTAGELSDLGWSLEPWSLADVVRRAARYRLPIVVTEHGAVDGATPDVRRRRYLAATLAHLTAAISQGADVRGYLHWSLLDNFEWSHGYGARCGLFRVDRGDLHRTPTSSAALYRDLIAAQNPDPAGDRA